MRLIDADALIADLYDEKKHNLLIARFKLCTADMVDLKFLINEAPTIDAAPVVHGEWIWTERGDEDYEQYFVCSKCGQQQYVETNYCPDCGAKMDGGKEE